MEGGGVYLESGDFTIQGENASIKQNTAAKNGGGVYLKSGTFTMDGESVSISRNNAENGGGVYLSTNPILLEGTISNNTVTGNGGGMYISDCLVTMDPTGHVIITQNMAENGGGIYIHRLTGSSGAGGNTEGAKTTGSTNPIDVMSSSTPDHKVGLHVVSTQAESTGHVSFTDNKAKQSGGAVCIDEGYFVLESDNITVTKNTAEQSGGGVAVLCWPRFLRR